MSDINEILGYSFKSPELLELALTHSSVHGGRHTFELVDYERLEFLGDRVLGLLVADLLMDEFPNEDEGALAKRHASLVRRETLADVVLDMGIDKYVKLGVSDEALRGNKTVLGDVCEAVIGAMYKDGGLEPVAKFVDEHWSGLLRSAVEPPKDSKTDLQEWAQKRGLALPKYSELSRSGPDHAPEFVIQVEIDGEKSCSAIGTSKREGQQNAAALMLEQINTKDVGNMPIKRK